MSVEGWFTSEDLVLAPGTTATLPLTVHNLGRATDSYTIVPAGLNAAWTSVADGNLTLFAGSRETIAVTVSPPALPTTPAGPTVVAVRITSESDPDASMVAETTIGIAEFDDRRVVPLHPVVRARRRATFERMVENQGNALASCRLRLVDPSNRVDGDFDPPAVGVPPGGATLVQLRARAVGHRFRRATRTLEFEAEAEQPGHAPAAAPFALLQSPTISGATVRRALGALALVAGLIGAWVWVVDPALDDAASRRVEERIDELVAAQPAPTLPAGSDQQAPSEPVADDEQDVGTPVFERLVVDARIGATANATYTVPSDVLFDLTDVRVENPGRDDGVARLLVNGDPLFVWPMSDIRLSVFEPRITPIRLQPGDSVTFSVRCDSPTNGAACSSTALLLVGTVQPADS